MRILLSFAVAAVLTCTFATQNAHATLQLQIVGNGLNTVFSDGDAGDANGAGSISVDLATLAGWQGGTTFVVTADVAGTTLLTGSGGGKGEVRVAADYDFTGGIPFTTITVAASELFNVAGGPIDFFRGEASITGAGALTRSEHYFSTSFPDPAPLNPFNFTTPPTYPFSLTIAPPTQPAPFSGSVTSAPGINFGTRLRVANVFEVVLNPGQVGTVTNNTIVNPEPTSLLLSSVGLAACGTVYRRRRKAAQSEATS